MKRLLASCSILAALAAGPANAAVLLDSSTTYPGFFSYSMGTSEKTGVVFTTGSSAITINNLSVLLKGSSAAVNNASVTVDLFRGSPTTLGASSPSSSAAQATLTTNVNLLASAALTSVGSASSYATSINTGGGTPWTLLANQQYFLAVSTTTSGVSWVYTATGSTPSVSSGISTYDGWGGYLGASGTTRSFPNGNEVPWIIISDTASGGGGGGGSSVPDAGPGPALALLLGGLGFRQWRASRRTRAAA
jgi:hypothetical protein